MVKSKSWRLFTNFVGVPDPTVTFTGNDHAAIGDGTHDEQGQNGRPDR